MQTSEREPQSPLLWQDWQCAGLGGTQKPLGLLGTLGSQKNPGELAQSDCWVQGWTQIRFGRLSSTARQSSEAQSLFWLHAAPRGAPVLPELELELELAVELLEPPRTVPLLEELPEELEVEVEVEVDAEELLKVVLPDVVDAPTEVVEVLARVVAEPVVVVELPAVVAVRELPELLVARPVAPELALVRVTVDVPELPVVVVEATEHSPFDVQTPPE